MSKQTYATWYAFAVVFGLAVFIAAAISASMSSMPGWEVRSFLSIYDWPDFLRYLFLLITQLGSVSMIIATTLVSYLSHYRQLAWRFFLTGSVAYLIVMVAKNMVDRPRPYLLLSNIHERELVVVSGKGFPSGHTAVATALALTLMPHLSKRWRWLLVIWIIGVGLSRVYLGVHAPLDVIGGFGIGIAVASTLHFFLDTDKTLRKTLPKR